MTKTYISPEDRADPRFGGKTLRQVRKGLKNAADRMLTPRQANCLYCHEPYKLFDNGDRLIPPATIRDWWGLMPRYSSDRIATIMKIDKCPECGRKLNE